MKKILVINGCNLNLLGRREPEIYGYTTLLDIENMCIKYGESLNCQVECFQSNSEYEIINKIHEAKNKNFSHIIINAGAYTHTSIAIMDAIKAVNIPTIEVHLSNIYQREDFRQKSYISLVSQGTICGFKEYGYIMAIDFICKN